MGEIKSVSVEGDSVIVSLKLEKQEYLNLGGHCKDILCITPNAENYPSKISSRGRESLTRYLLIPRKLRPGLPEETISVKCQKLEIPNSNVLVYFVPKKEIL